MTNAPRRGFAWYNRPNRCPGDRFEVERDGLQLPMGDFLRKALERMAVVMIEIVNDDDDDQQSNQIEHTFILWRRACFVTE